MTGTDLDLAKQPVFTQFGLIPRDQLVYFDTVVEHPKVFVTNRAWYLKTQVKALIEGEERLVDALLFARNDVNASALCGNELGALANTQDAPPPQSTQD